MNSMTGYGRSQTVSGGLKAVAEFSSVNGKQSDIRLNLPAGMPVLRPRIEKLVRDAVSRGCVTGRIDVDMTGVARTKGVFVDIGLAQAWLGSVRKAGRKLGLKDDLTLRSLLDVPGAILTDAPPADGETSWPVIERATRAALKELRRTRSVEGKALKSHLSALLRRLRPCLRILEKHAAASPLRLKASLKRKMKNAGCEVPGNDPAMLKELALLCQRSDVGEEVERMKSHLGQFDGLMSAGKPVGREMDFLCREMIREINTLAAKAGDARMSRHVLKFHTDLESLREQVQNVE